MINEEALGQLLVGTVGIVFDDIASAVIGIAILVVVFKLIRDLVEERGNV